MNVFLFLPFRIISSFHIIFVAMQVNFDTYLYNFLKENEKLCKLDIPLPSINQGIKTLKKLFAFFYFYAAIR